MEKIKILTYNDSRDVVDSYYVSTNNIIKKDTSRVYPDNPLRSDFDFQIVVEIPGLTYNLSNVETRKEDCNCGSGSFKVITGYTLNGVQHSSSNINPLLIKK